jgi:hypothetical protein
MRRKISEKNDAQATANPLRDVKVHWIRERQQDKNSCTHWKYEPLKKYWHGSFMPQPDPKRQVTQGGQVEEVAALLVKTLQCFVGLPLISRIVGEIERDGRSPVCSIPMFLLKLQARALSSVG